MERKNQEETHKGTKIKRSLHNISINKREKIKKRETVIIRNNVPKLPKI